MKRTGSALVATLLAMLMLFSTLPAPGGLATQPAPASGNPYEQRLYLREGGKLNTSMGLGLDYSVDVTCQADFLTDLEIIGFDLGGGDKGFRVGFATTSESATSTINVTISHEANVLAMRSMNIAALQVAFTEYNIPFNDSISAYTIPQGDALSIRIQTTSGTANIIYDGATASTAAYFSFECLAVADVTDTFYDARNETTNTFYPNDSPYGVLTIRGEILDTFGPYDVDIDNIEVQLSMGTIVSEGMANAWIDGDIVRFEYTWNYTNEDPDWGNYHARISIPTIQGHEYIHDGSFVMKQGGVLLTSPSQAPGEQNATTNGSYGGTGSMKVKAINRGGDTTDISLSLSSNPGGRGFLTTSSFDNVLPGSTRTFYLMVDLQGLSEGDQVWLNITAVEVLQGDSYTMTAIITVSEYGYTIDVPDDQTIFMGEAGLYTITIENTGTVSDTIHVTLAEDSSGGWSASLDKSQVTLAVGSSEDVTLTVNAPVTMANDTESWTMVIQTVSGGDPYLEAEDWVKTTATKGLNVTIEGDSSGTATVGGDPLELKFKVNNIAPIDGTFTLKASTSGEGWELDEDVSFSPQSPVTISAGQSSIVSMLVSPSGDVRSGTHAMTVKATWSGKTISDEVTFQVIVEKFSRLDIVEDNETKTVEPGGVTNFNVTVINAGNGVDVVNVSVTLTYEGESYDQWVTVGSPQFSMQPKEERAVNIDVAVPESAIIGDYTLKVTARVINRDVNVTAEPMTLDVDATTGFLIKRTISDLFIHLILLVVIIAVAIIGIKKY